MGTVAGKQGSNKKRRSLAGHGIYSRAAHHAGSWYSDSPRELDVQLTSLLTAAENESAEQTISAEERRSPLRGIICPHAGYSYSGPTAAFSYHHLATEMAKEDSPITQILVLHPSHHVYLDGCAVSGATQLETPLGNIMVDDELRQEILGLLSPRSIFEVMEQSVDEREHSGEMQYPYIAKALLKANKLDSVKVLPIICGTISASQEEDYGKLLAPIVGRPNVLCVVSTDFCHWGKRFQYQPTTNSENSTTTMEIHEYIRAMDHQGMKHIELEQPGAFADYLKQTRNTICGRHAIGVWLNAVHSNNPTLETLDISFVKYAQSSQVRSMRESSVSYASATARQQPKK
jgi:AmmeMemoRadiSam system protein B